jgi:hypothetical protein
MKSAREIELEQLDGKFRKIERRVHEIKDEADPGAELDEQASKLMREQPAEFKEYSAAVDHVLKGNADLASRYAASFGTAKLAPRQVREFGVENVDDMSSVRAGEELDKLALQYQRDHTSLQLRYEDCLARMMDAHPDLAMLYKKSFNKDAVKKVKQYAADDDDESGAGAGKEIDRLAMAIQREHPSLSYESCLGRVRESRPDLWKKYAAKRG